MDPTRESALELDDDELDSISRPLRETPIILIMSANPKDDLQLDEEMREIRTGLELTEFGRRFELELRPATVYTDLQRYVAETTPTILHFSGHGDVPGIMLEDPRGDPYLVPGTALAKLLSLPFIKDRLRLVVLNACLSEPQARLIAQEIDVVVGMASNIGDEAAINFARGLYSGLGMGQDVPAAFALATNAIEIAGLPEELTPQMIVREGVDASLIVPVASSPSRAPRPPPSTEQEGVKPNHIVSLPASPTQEQQLPPASAWPHIERIKRRPVVALLLVVAAGITWIASFMGGLAQIGDAIGAIGRQLGFISDPLPEVGATLSNVRVANTHVTLRDFLVDHFELRGAAAQDNDQLRAALPNMPGLPDDPDMLDAALGTVGIELVFDVALDGLAGRKCLLKWSLYDAKLRRPLPEAYLNDQPAFPYGALVPDGQRDRSTPSIWIAQPPRTGPFFVRLAVYDDRPAQTRVRLAEAESEPFSLAPPQTDPT